MLIEITPTADVDALRGALSALGLWTRALSSPDGKKKSLLVTEGSRACDPDQITRLPGVAEVFTEGSPHPRLDAMGPVVHVRGVPIGGPEPVLMAGPCSVESEAQIDQCARIVAAAGGKLLRGGAFKPRTSPHSFQGVGEVGLRWMREAADAHDLGVVTEAMGESHLPAVAEVADLIQIGARNMQNYALLHAVGRTGVPAMLKRGLAATIDEWLLAAEHLLDAGCPGVVFCERGIRHFDSRTRFLFDVGAIAVLRDVYGVPVIADPSHAAGRRDLIPRLSLSALAAGASGLIVESHPDAAAARSDAAQQLTPGELLALGGTIGASRRRREGGGVVPLAKRAAG